MSRSSRSRSHRRAAELRARDAGLDDLPRRVEPRVRRLQRAPDRLGDLRHRELFNLVEDEHRALVVVELVEDPIERHACLPERDGIVLSASCGASGGTSVTTSRRTRPLLR